MAQFSIVVLPAKRLKDGRHKIRIAVSHASETRYIVTNYLVDSPDEISGNQVVGRGDAGYINVQLRKRLNELQEIYDTLDDPDIFTCSQLVEILKRKGSAGHKLFEEVYAEYTGLLEQKGQTSSVKLYRLARDRFEDYFKTKEILLEVIQPKDIVGFDAALRKRGLSAATIKTYVSLVKVVIDYAQKMKYVKYEVDPFEFYSMPNYEPRELWFTVDEFRKVYDDRPTLYNHVIIRDIWLLTFFLGGANIVDILGYNFKGKKSMRYQRTKTKNAKKESGWTVFDLQPEALSIINRYVTRTGRLKFGRYVTKSTISMLFDRENDNYMASLGIDKNFILMAARKTFFQIGFDNKESTDVLDYCVGHARSKRMAMNYAMVKPEMASACMRRVFDIAIGTKTEQLEQKEPELEQSEQILEQRGTEKGETEKITEKSESERKLGESASEKEEEWTTLWQ